MRKKTKKKEKENEKGRKKTKKKGKENDPVAKRHHMVSGTLALLYTVF